MHPRPTPKLRGYCVLFIILYSINTGYVTFFTCEGDLNELLFLGLLAWLKQQFKNVGIKLQRFCVKNRLSSPLNQAIKQPRVTAIKKTCW